VDRLRTGLVKLGQDERLLGVRPGAAPVRLHEEMAVSVSPTKAS
jgi:hypothetical protein